MLIISIIFLLYLEIDCTDFEEKKREAQSINIVGCVLYYSIPL